MRTGMRLLAAAGLVALLAGTGMAAEIPDGANELFLNFSYEDTDDVGKTTELDLAYGFFLTSRHEVGPIISYLKVDPDGGPDSDANAFGGFYRFNFGTASETFEPFVGANIQGIGGDLGDFFDYQTGLEAGTRVMAGRRGALNVMLFYDKLYGADDVEDSDSMGIAAGLSIFFDVGD